MPRRQHTPVRIASRWSAAATRADLTRIPWEPHAGEADRDAEVAALVAAAREQARTGLHRDQQALAADIADRRCDGCGYRSTHCCCPGGPRGGAA